MRTLQIGNDWPGERVGGLNRYYVELLRALEASGHRSKGLVVGPPSVAAESKGVVEPFARSQDNMLLRWFAARRAAVRELRQGHTEVIASHFALYTAPLGAWMRKVPMVVHFHGPWAAESGVEGARSFALKAKFALERSVYRKGRLFIVLSRSFQQELTRRYGIPQERIRIIPGGIDTDRFSMRLSRQQAREQLGWPADRTVLLAVRRLVRRMGLENLIDAMRAVVAVAPDAVLYIGGSGPVAAELQQRIRDHGLEQHVRLLGRLSEADLPVAYRAADMTVVPSQALEGFGMITLESLASGTPVLVTPVGGLPEVVAPFAPECVFADTSTQAIQQLLTEVVTGRRTLPADAACQHYAAQNFHWSLIASRVAEVYAEAQHRR